MNWEITIAIVEIVGVIAVILTLVYLAKQIKDNTRISAAASRQSISESLLSNTISFFSDPEFRRIFNKHLHDKNLDEDELLYIETYSYFFFRNFENIHYQFRVKMLSIEDWTAYRKNLKALCQTPALRNFWNRESENFNKSFHSEVRQILDEIEVGEPLMPKALFHPKKSTETH